LGRAKRRWAAGEELEGVAACWRKKIEGRLRDFGNWAESGHGPKRRMIKRKENEFLLISRILFPGKE
jgi:hypothetical protein